MRRLKTLIHLHTDYSYDSNISLDLLDRFVKREGLDCVAITDHNSIEGAIAFRDRSGVRVIVGEEVSTTDGHLIGLFLQTRVRPGLSARDTAIAIRDQGGIVLLPHPFVRLFGCGVRDVSYDLIGLLDAVEVNNAQNLLGGPDRAARRFAAQFDLPGFVGADSHMAMSIAPCYQWMPDFDGPTGFLTALRSAELTPGRHPLAFFAATGYRLLRHYAGLSLGGEFGLNAACRPCAAPRLASVRPLQA